MSEVKTITLHDSRILSILDEDGLDFDLFKSRNRKKCRIYLLSKITEEQIVEHRLVSTKNLHAHKYGCDIDEVFVMNYETGNHEWDYVFSYTQSFNSLLKVNGIDTTKEWVLILKK